MVVGSRWLRRRTGQQAVSAPENLAHRFASLLQDKEFMAALPGHMPPDTSSPARWPLVEERIRVIAGGIQ